MHHEQQSDRPFIAPRSAPPVGKPSNIGPASHPAIDFSQPLHSFNGLAPFAPPPSGKSLSGQLAVVCCYFNPCGYQSQKRNYCKFAAGIREQGVALYTIELAFGDEPFFLAPADNVVQLRTSHVLWHKERLLNLLIRRLPAQFDKVAWIDALQPSHDPRHVSRPLPIDDHHLDGFHYRFP